jgi:hypothetical protein
VTDTIDVTGVPPVLSVLVLAALASPLPPLQHPIGEGWDHEAYEDSLAFTRPVFPSPVVPGWNGDPSASSPGFAPHGHP